MIEKIKPVRNPLTIIAIFAGLAELAGTIALGIVKQELQEVFIWFVILFPILLVILFFITLNFNSKVLYAPSDFKDESNFLTLLRQVDQISLSTDKAYQELEIGKVDSLFQKVAVFLVHGSNKIELPLELRRIDLSRPEILGRIGMIPMKASGTRFKLRYLSSPQFLQQLNKIRENDGEAEVVIPCTADEFSQFYLA